MLILITIIFIVIWTLIMGGVYSIFSPFINNVKNIADYNVAYYGAISWIERAELALKYHWPWFEWSWGYIWDAASNQWGPDEDKKAGLAGINFGKLTKSSNGFYRDIKSRTSWLVPKTGKWNVDLEFQLSSDSQAKNYNKLEPNMSEQIWLDIDDTTTPWDYYKGGFETTRTVSKIDFYFRRNPWMFNKWIWPLDIYADYDNDYKQNDAITTWSIIWTDLDYGSFSIQPYIRNSWTASAANRWHEDNDWIIRKYDINDSYPAIWHEKITFENWQNPYSEGTISSWQNMIPAISWLVWKSFKDIFQDGNIKWMSLKFSLVNMMTTTNWVYPFLEYKIDAGTAQIADRFFHIQWVGRVWDYEVVINIEKPTYDTTTNSEFVIYF